MGKTPNHGYQIPSKGSSDWHVPLNENFELLDASVPVRDVDSNRGQYTPSAGAKFEATDTGALYYGDGSNWVPATRKLKTLTVDGLSNGPAEGFPQSVSAGLTSGYLMGVDHYYGVKSVDPVEYATDDAAFQTLVDWIESNGHGGSIYASARSTDGSELTIENTVTMDESIPVPISWYFMDHASKQGPHHGSSITTTINDGSPMFDVCGNVQGDQMIVGIEFIGKAWDLKENNAGVVRFRDVGNARIELGKVRNNTGDALVMDSKCMDNTINNTIIKPKGSIEARGIVFDNSENVDGPSVGADHVVGPFVKMDGDFDVGIANPGGHARVRIGGKIEGASGLANITNTGGGAMLITPYCVLGRNHDGAHGLYTDSHYTVFAPSMLTNIVGDGIHVGPNANTVIISPSIKFNGITGDSIHFETDTNAIVPYENMIHGTVTYPPAPWSRMYYVDGWQKYRSGISTVSAGSSEKLHKWAGRFGTEVRCNWWVNSQPSSEVELVEKRGANGSNGHQDLIVEETTGNSDVEVGYIVYRRGQSENLG